MTREQAAKEYVQRLLAAGYTRRHGYRGQRYAWSMPDGTRAYRIEVTTFLLRSQPSVTGQYLADNETWRLMAQIADA